MNPQRMIHVLAVDDSAVTREKVSGILNSEEDITVVTTATDGFNALQKVNRQAPDVGIMAELPAAVVMTYSGEAPGKSVEAKLADYGAAEIIALPSENADWTRKDLSALLVQKVWAAGRFKSVPDTLTIEQR